MILSVKLGGTTPYPVTAAGLAQCAVDDLAATDSCVANYLSQFSDCKATACRTAEACPIAESLVQPHLGKASAEILKSSFKSVALQSFGYGMPIITEDQQSPILVKDGRAAVRLKIITTITQEGIDFRTRSEGGAKEAVDIPSTDWNYHSIALHHAGNSFGCLVDGAEGIRSAEAIDINSLIIIILIISGWFFLGIERYVGDHEIGVYWDVFIKNHPSNKIIFSNPSQKGLDFLPFSQLDAQKQRDFLDYCNIRYGLTDIERCYQLSRNTRI